MLTLQTIVSVSRDLGDGSKVSQPPICSDGCLDDAGVCTLFIEVVLEAK